METLPSAPPSYESICQTPIEDEINKAVSELIRIYKETKTDKTKVTDEQVDITNDILLTLDHPVIPEITAFVERYHSREWFIDIIAQNRYDDYMCATEGTVRQHRGDTMQLALLEFYEHVNTYHSAVIYTSEYKYIIPDNAIMIVRAIVKRIMKLSGTCGKIYVKKSTYKEGESYEIRMKVGDSPSPTTPC